MVMLVVQHNCGQGYESTIMALETALSIGAGIVMVLLVLETLVTVLFIFTGPKRKEKR